MAKVALRIRLTTVIEIDCEGSDVEECLEDIYDNERIDVGRLFELVMDSSNIIESESKFDEPEEEDEEFEDQDSTEEVEKSSNNQQ